MGIINYENIDKYIMDIEKILGELDIEERRLILRFIQDGVNRELQKKNVNDTLSENPLISFANKFVKNNKDSLEDKG